MYQEVFFDSVILEVLFLNIKVEFRGEKVIVYTDKKVYEDMLGNISCMIAEGNWKVLEFLDIERGFDKLQAYALCFLDNCFYSKEKLMKINGYMLCNSELELNKNEYKSYKNVSGRMINGKVEMIVSDTYLIQSVTELINLEMIYAVINDIPITKCRNCNRYFVATNAGVYYCDRVFNANRTCKQIGAKKLFNDNLKTDKAFLVYEKTYQATYYRAKVAKTKEEKELLNERLKELKNYRLMYKRGEISEQRFVEILEAK